MKVKGVRGATPKKERAVELLEEQEDAKDDVPQLQVKAGEEDLARRFAEEISGTLLFPPSLHLWQDR